MPEPRWIARRWFVAPALLLAALLAGCVGIPTSGSVQVGGVIDEDDQVLPDFEVQPDGPTPDSDPSTLLADFMQAVQSPAGGFAIAKEFMTDEFAAAWDPNAQVTVRRGASQIVTGEGTDLAYVFSSGAWVDAQGRYTETPPSEQRLAYSFQQVNGQWRISAAPPGIVLTVNSFDAVFRAVPLYFFDPAYNYLVPDVRWVPVRSTANERAVRLLLDGPAEWLSQSVVSEFPEGTTLEIGGVVINSTSATVFLSPEAAQANALQLSRMRQQLAATLGVATVVLSIGGGVGLTGNASTAIVDPLVDGTVLVGTADAFGYPGGDGIVPITDLSDRVVGAGADAVTVFGQRVAAFRAGGTVFATTTSSDAAVPIDDRPGLVAPSLDPYGFVWTVPSDSAAGIAVHDLQGNPVQLASGLAPDSRVVSMDVSRDGARLLLTMVNGVGSPEVVVYGIVRGDDNVPVGVGSSFSFVATGTPIDAAWVNDRNVVVLMSSADGAVAVDYEVGGPSAVLGSVPNAVQVVGGNQGRDGIRVLDASGSVLQLRGRNWQAVAGLTAGYLGVQQGRER
jgi:hypothetical protein